MNGNTVLLVRLLAGNLTHPGHELWTDAVNVPDAVKEMEAGLHGYRRLTDAYLLALAHRRKGVLATFDRGIRPLAGGKFDGALEIVGTR
jgi:predicted nucleic acid-binding protein